MSKVGTVDYDFDKYGNRIRKFVVVKEAKVNGVYEPIWEEKEKFEKEKGLSLGTYNYGIKGKLHYGFVW